MIKNDRTCVVTQRKLPKDKLLRVVKTSDSKFYVNSDMPGRGCYVGKDVDPGLLLRNKVLHRAFRTTVPSAVYDELILQLKEVQHEKR